VRIYQANGNSLDLSGSYDGIGLGTYQAVRGSTRVTVPLN